MIKIAPKWKDTAKNVLDPEDEIKRTFSGRFDGKNGYLLMSNKKLLFVQEEGFIRRAYELVLDLPYDKIGNISHEGRYELNLNDTEGKKHGFRPYDVNASVVERHLNELMKPTEE